MPLRLHNYLDWLGDWSRIARSSVTCRRGLLSSRPHTPVARRARLSRKHRIGS
jgi:hypothetical protein